MRGSQFAVRFGGVVGIAGCEMVNVDMEMDAIGEVVGGGEGAEAAGERVEAVEGEDFDDEGEIGGIGAFRVRVLKGIEEIRVRVREMGVEEDEEEGGDGEEEEEWEEASFGTQHFGTHQRD